MSVLPALLLTLLPQGPALAHAQSLPASRPRVPVLVEEGWTLEHGGFDTQLDSDSEVLVVQSPVFRRGAEEARATWAVFWLDRAKVQQRSPGLGPEGEIELPTSRPERRAAGKSGTLYERMRTSPLGELAREIYLEGPIEYFRRGELVATAEAVYLDMIDGHGWISDASIYMEQRFLGGEHRLRAHAQWMRHSADGSLHANNATITTCDFEKPHVYVTSANMRMLPNPGDPEHPYRVEVRDNRITFYDLFSIPLPSYSLDMSEEGRPTFESFRLGSSGKYGFLLGVKLNFGMGNFGRNMNKTLGGDPENSKADTSLSVALLGKRGLLFDSGLELRSKDLYWLDLYLGLVTDIGEDKGLVKIDKDDHGLLRTWLHSRGRYLLDERQWLDLALSVQSDPGVQAEFFEGDFLRYEQRDNYLHWRKARAEDFLYASAKVRLDDFRADTEELPSLGYYHGRSELARLGSASLLYSSDTSAAWLRRLEGDPDVHSPFEQASPYADGLGERDVLRADTRQRMELAFAWGPGALRWTPFAELRGTAWSEDTLEEDSPTRGAALAGMRLATSFWKPLSSGGLAQFAPYAEVRGDLAVEENGGQPVTFDQVEQPLIGRFVEAGAFTHWQLDSIDTQVTLDVHATHASSVAAGEEDGWLPMGIYAALSTRIRGLPVGLVHDARYDFSPHETVYSLTSIGAGVKDEWGVEMSHRRGLDEERETLFEAASIAARYRWTPKWEWEAREIFSLLGGGSLSHKAILRRYGHDTVFEIELSARSGEGDNTINFNFKPLVGYNPSDIGLLDPWNQ